MHRSELMRMCRRKYFDLLQEERQSLADAGASVRAIKKGPVAVMGLKNYQKIVERMVMSGTDVSAEGELSPKVFIVVIL